MGEAEIVSLWCPEYLKLLSEGVWRLFQTKYKSDFSLLSIDGEQRVDVHQNLLSIFCPQFNGYLGQQFHFRLTQLNSDELNLLLEFVYRGHISVNRQLLDKLRLAAEELGLKQLMDAIDSSKNNPDSNDKTVTDVKPTRKVKNKVKKVSSVDEVEAGDQIHESDNGYLDEVLKRDGRKLKPGWTKVEEEKTSTNKEPFKCPHCNYVTNRKDSFRNHLDIHDDHREYVCEVCTRRFRNRRRYSSHVRGHKHPERMLKCDRCDYTTATRTTLTQHLASRHHVDAQGNELTADVKCSECDFVCVSKFQLRNHRLYKHSIKPFKCGECDFTAVRKTLVDKHFLMKHQNLRPHLCDTCGFRSKTISAFHSHLMVHTNSKPFKCDSCAKAYKHNYQLRAHQRSHIGNGKPFLCHVCCMAFRRNYEMQVHIRQKHTVTELPAVQQMPQSDESIVEMIIEPFEDEIASVIKG